MKVRMNSSRMKVRMNSSKKNPIQPDDKIERRWHSTEDKLNMIGPPIWLQIPFVHDYTTNDCESPSFLA